MLADREYDYSKCKRKKIYVYLEEANKIVSTTIPIISKKLKQEMAWRMEIPYISLSSQWGEEKDLINFIYDYTYNKCKIKVKRYYKDKIEELELKKRSIK